MRKMIFLVDHHGEGFLVTEDQTAAGAFGRVWFCLGPVIFQSNRYPTERPGRSVLVLHSTRHGKLSNPANLGPSHCVQTLASAFRRHFCKSPGQGAGRAVFGQWPMPGEKTATPQSIYFVGINLLLWILGEIALPPDAFFFLVQATGLSPRDPQSTVE